MHRTGMDEASIFRHVLAVLLLTVAPRLVMSADAIPTGNTSTTITADRIPMGLDNLLQMQRIMTGLADRLQNSTVSIQVGATQGSGVIVTPDGKVLTAAHVAGRSGQSATVVLSDGREAKGVVLGVNQFLDIAMIRLEGKGPWPFSPLSDAKKLPVGTWCLATGHPGGIQEDRPPVVRLGRLVNIRELLVQSDCTLEGGDSGGPLFDLEGDVIGVHSRIGLATDANFHIPSPLIRKVWDDLAELPESKRPTLKRADSPPPAVQADLPPKGRPTAPPVKRRPQPEPEKPTTDKSAVAEKMSPTPAILGVFGVDDPDNGCRITQIVKGLPAESSELQVGDIIRKVDSQRIDGFQQLRTVIRRHHPGERVKLLISRDGTNRMCEVKLGGISK